MDLPGSLVVLSQPEKSTASTVPHADMMTPMPIDFSLRFDPSDIPRSASRYSYQDDAKIEQVIGPLEGSGLSDWRGLPGTVRLEVFAAQEALPAQLGIRCAGRDRNRPRDHR